MSSSSTLDDHWPIDICATFRMYCIFEIFNDILIIKNTLTLSAIANGEINQVHESFKYFRRSLAY